MSDTEMNVAQMRETIERLSKEKAGLEKQVEEVPALRNRVREYEAKDAFRAAGYNPNHGELYAAIHPDGEITEESVVEFATRQSLSPVGSGTPSENEDGQESTSKAQEQAALAALAGSGSGAGDGGSGGAQVETLTRQQWQELYANDPIAAKQAVASGRVEISKDNVYSSAKPAQGVNPFVPVVTDA